MDIWFSSWLGFQPNFASFYDKIKKEVGEASYILERYRKYF